MSELFRLKAEFFMGAASKERHPTVRVRRVLGLIRRSAAVSDTTRFLGVQRRRVQQRLSARFIRGVHLSTTDYLEQEPASQLGEYIHCHGYEETNRVDGPTFVPENPAIKIGGPITVRSSSLGVAMLRRPWVVGLDGTVIGRDRRLLWDLSYAWPGLPHQHPAYDLKEMTAAELPGSTATLATMGASSNYFHFLLNSVARLVYLEHPFPIFSPDRYLIAGAVTDFVADTLALFGISRSRLIGTADFPAVRPEQLIAPSLIQHPFVVPAHVCQFIRDRVLSKLPPPASRRRRILVDRSDAPARRIQNLGELQPVLDQFGVELVRLTGLSLVEQATLFRDAELVIANHGAALTNLVFCNPGTRVLQVLAPGMMEREYRTISQHGRLHHDYVVGDFASPTDATLALKQRDLVLSPSILRRILEAEF